ncbi:hypothetical protein CYLTODRAFT_439765 [Cylindrobasidium torrendii FP15055 ss-10]|uniref:DRBM domain-containing protein n=1 Tax=Cylindrobasidium torrendii FP15055 ss-10 TaxID=1314674 RepID=A0A0D7BT86_9AGAR|nr:hypothetical protein CYLTODRAFT_439765 [Cylindrobasidium torrendii FP15055 ss-10]
MTTPTLPPLPTVQGDYNIMLDILTDVTARNPDDDVSPEYGDPSRLEMLGKKAAEAAAFYHFFALGTSGHDGDQLPPEQLNERVVDSLRAEKIVQWMDGYGLKSRIACYPHNMRNNEEVVLRSFWIYVGALYIRNGHNVVQDWISRLIDPTHVPPHMAGGGVQNAPMHPSTFVREATGMPPPPQPMGQPPPPPPSPPPLTGTDKLITLQVVNQAAQQKGYVVTYPASSDGPPHNPTWHVRCALNGQEMGEGRARSQKVAKEEAARMAYKAMGWA